MQDLNISPCLLGSFRLRVQIVPGHTCNFFCPFCHRDGDWKNDSTLRLRPSFVLSLYRAAQQFGCTGISFTGGEPLLHPHLDDFLSVLKGEDLSITTNGSRLSRQRVRRLSGLGMNRLIISLPSVVDKSYYLLTGQSSISPGRVLEGISEAVKLGLRVTVNMPLCRGVNDSAGELKEMFDSCDSLGVSELHLLEMVRHPKNLNTEDLHFPISEISEQDIEGLAFIGSRLFGQSYLYKQSLTVSFLMCGSCSTICRSCPSAASLLVTSRGTLKPCMWYEHHEIPVDEENAALAVEQALDFIRYTTVPSPVTFYPGA